MASIRLLFVFMPLLAILPAIVWAENSWSLPEACYAQSVLDRECAAQAAEDAQSRLQTTVERITEKLRADIRSSKLNSGESSRSKWHQNRLRRFSDLQHAWQAYRDATCKAAAYEYHQGSLAQSIEYACRLETATAHRRRLLEIYHAELGE